MLSTNEIFSIFYEFCKIHKIQLKMDNFNFNVKLLISLSSVKNSIVKSKILFLLSHVDPQEIIKYDDYVDICRKENKIVFIKHTDGFITIFKDRYLHFDCNVNKRGIINWLNEILNNNINNNCPICLENVDDFKGCKYCGNKFCVKCYIKIHDDNYNFKCPMCRCTI